MTVHIVSIRDATPDDVLAFDLKDVLAALGKDVTGLRFAVRALDATGPGADDAAAQVRAAGTRGLSLTFDELQALAARVDQSIDAEVVAYPAGTDLETLSPSDLNLAKFPSNRMVLAILAVDSSVFEVYAKDATIEKDLAARFRDVRREDPTPYFD
ncbi:MAG: hypothetical protein K8W52_41415 [Deltaproteobacteria bacterium]|nr:hypothetical protein [Deltaproteobacteria bacterium]